MNRWNGKSSILLERAISAFKKETAASSAGKKTATLDSRGEMKENRLKGVDDTEREGKECRVRAAKETGRPAAIGLGGPQTQRKEPNPTSPEKDKVHAGCSFRRELEFLDFEGEEKEKTARHRNDGLFMERRTLYGRDRGRKGTEKDTGQRQREVTAVATRREKAQIRYTPDAGRTL